MGVEYVANPFMLCEFIRSVYKGTHFYKVSVENGVEETEGVTGQRCDGGGRCLLQQIQNEARLVVERSVSKDRGRVLQNSGGSGNGRPLACGRCLF